MKLISHLKTIAIWLVVGFVLLIIFRLFLVEAEGEYARINSPDGKYTAIATYSLSQLIIPRFPGQSGDKVGYVRIEGSNGIDYGKIPVPMIYMVHDIQWTNHGAQLVAVGDWDFAKREYRYWNKDQTKQYVRHVQ